MNRKAKGSRNELKSKRYLEARGYVCTKAGGSLGVWDLIGIGTADVVLVQVKSNRNPAPKEMAAMAAFHNPSGVRKFLHVWKDYKREPEITCIM